MSRLNDVLKENGLTLREREVVELVVKGLSNKQVANQLFVLEQTVKFHLTNVYKKLKLSSRAQLIVLSLHENYPIANGKTSKQIFEDIVVGKSSILSFKDETEQE